MIVQKKSAEEQEHERKLTLWSARREALKTLEDLDIEGEINSAGELVYWTSDRQEAKRVIKDLGGKWTKEYSAFCVIFTQKLAFTTFKLYVSRSSVCERVVTGKRLVPEQILPAHEEEIVEWECRDSIMLEDADVSIG
jgi:hypothetical protein